MPQARGILLRDIFNRSGNAKDASTDITSAYIDSFMPTVAVFLLCSAVIAVHADCFPLSIECTCRPATSPIAMKY